MQAGGRYIELVINNLMKQFTIILGLRGLCFTMVEASRR